MQRILIVDDDATTLRTFSRMFVSRYEVTRCASAEDALGLIGLGKRFDVILCDLAFGRGLSGRELFDRLLATAPNQAARLLFFTGTKPDDRVLPRSLHHRVILKGSNLEEMRSRIEAVSGADEDVPLRRVS